VHVGLELLEVVLEGGAGPREVALPEALDAHVLLAGARQEVLGRPLPLGRPLGARGEHDPVEPGVREALDEAQDRAAAPDLDVVAVGPEAQDVQRVVGRLGQPQRAHHAAPARARQTAQGGSPRLWRSSRTCRSLNVSMGTKNPSCRYVVSAEMSMSRW